MSVDLLFALSGGLLSLVFSYFPRLKDWFGSLAPDARRFVMLAALAVVSFVGVYGLSCLGVSGQYGLPAVDCTPAGLQVVVRAFIFAMIANQSTYQLTPSQK